MPNHEDIQTFIEGLNSEYARLHTEKEELFWKNKMGIDPDYESFNNAENALQRFRQSVENLNNCRAFADASETDEWQKTTLAGWIRFFESSVIESEEASALSEKITEMESNLAAARSRMDLGYKDPNSGELVNASSVALSLKVSSEDDEAIREACFHGLESIEPYVIDNGFLEIVKQRNIFARQLGYEDYYDWKVQTTEGFGKNRLFELLDDLEQRTREAGKRYVDEMAEKHGADVLKPWNFRYFTQGSSEKDLDPYMGFEDALLRWGKSFTALGFDYEQAELQLDLIVRKGKYENGFCHAPIVTYEDGNGRVRGKINFTSNAVPGQIGSGRRAANTLFHEGGHAAHFANIHMGAPCFSQEFAPTSASFAETQSMFCDSLLSDADWMARYAKNWDGETIPWEIVERATRLSHPGEVLMVRSLLIVCYAEKALYEMPESDLTTDKVIDCFKEIERRLFFLDRCPRPTLAVPHLLAGESACIYQGYVLALAGVAQTRHHFLETDGYLTDNPAIGPKLCDAYWKPGNGILFVDAIKNLTSQDFSMDALIEDVSMPVDLAVEKQKEKYEQGLKREAISGPVKLNATIKMVSGGDVIASTDEGSFEEMAQKYAEWVKSL